jgi:two-component system, NarL family, sensor histidine kinase UhpB
VDDGVGFSPETAAARAEEGHLGLRGLTDLVADAGGLMTVDSGPGKGTRLHLQMPIEGG